MIEDEFPEEDHLIPDAFHFLEEIACFAEEEIAKEEADGMRIGEVLFVWRADQMHCLLNQLISVGTFAVAENHAREVLRNRGVVLSQRVVGGEIRQKLENILNRKLDTLSGYATLKDVRELSNCFKHRSGWPNSNMIAKSKYLDFIDIFQGDPEYARTLFWRYIDITQNIKEVQLFLKSLMQAVQSSTYYGDAV